MEANYLRRQRGRRRLLQRQRACSLPVTTRIYGRIISSENCRFYKKRLIQVVPLHMCLTLLRRIARRQFSKKNRGALANTSPTYRQFARRRPVLAMGQAISCS